MGLHFATALTPEGWKRNVRVGMEAGLIVAVTVDCAPEVDDERHGIGLPGMANVHSHAFQRGMAGLAEFRGTAPDSFWTWRETMYRFALALGPDEAEAVAAQAYCEMLEAGFTRVGEFHYLHHDLDGRPYSDIAEMAGRIVAAAALTGIGLTLLPVFYAHGNFGGAPPEPGQRRFLSDLDSFTRLLEASRGALKSLPGGTLGVAPHSLRAVTAGELAEVAGMAGSAPIHIHVAEQEKEVADSLAWSGARPIRWLLDNAEVDGRWCLIHATHGDEAETRAMARSGAIAGLCPVTEANLGDGIFAGPLFTGHGGRIAVGTDSNVGIGLAAELRQLEYAQRLRDRARNVMAVAGGSTGRVLFDAALDGGAAALGGGRPGLHPGASADIVSLDPDSPALVGRDGDALLDSWIFGNRSCVDNVWVRGVRQVEGGRHRRGAEVLRRYRAAIAPISPR